MGRGEGPYHEAPWKIVRPQVLKRDGYRCQIGLPKCRIEATAVDHIVDWRDGGAWFDVENLRSACVSCNTAQRNTRVAARARAQRDGTASDYHAGIGPRTELTW